MRMHAKQIASGKHGDLDAATEFYGRLSSSPHTMEHKLEESRHWCMPRVCVARPALTRDPAKLQEGAMITQLYGSGTYCTA